MDLRPVNEKVDERGKRAGEIGFRFIQKKQATSWSTKQTDRVVGVENK